jgi:hypothetical protein
MTKKNQQKVIVSERALVARINRRFRAEDEALELRKSRSEAMKRSYGPYYVLNTRHNVIQGYNYINLEEYAKEWDALRPWERLQS